MIGIFYSVSVLRVQTVIFYFFLNRSKVTVIRNFDIMVYVFNFIQS